MHSSGESADPGSCSKEVCYHIAECICGAGSHGDRYICGFAQRRPATALGSAAIAAAVAREELRPEEVETVVTGNGVQAGNKMNPGRQAAVRAGLPVTTPALTVNRVFGPGVQAIVSAAQEIALGNIHVAVAGGMENMDQAPYLIPRGRWGYRMGDGTLYDSVLRDGLNDAFPTRPPVGTPRIWSRNSK
jgi:acetyl-CoA acetyltransferase